MMARMASQKSANPQIQTLAQHLMNDYQQLLNKLEKLNNGGSDMDKVNDGTVSKIKRQDVTYSNLSSNEFDRR